MHKIIDSKVFFLADIFTDKEEAREFAAKLRETKTHVRVIRTVIKHKRRLQPQIDFRVFAR